MSAPSQLSAQTVSIGGLELPVEITGLPRENPYLDIDEYDPEGDLRLEPLESLKQGVGIGRATGNVDIHRQEGVDARNDRVDVPVEVA